MSLLLEERGMLLSGDVRAARDDCWSLPRVRMELYAVEVERVFARGRCAIEDFQADRLRAEHSARTYHARRARRYAPHEVVPVKLAQNG